VNGAQDPISGQIAEMEELRGYSELLKQGWKPKRTIIYAAWDGEEEGLLGSTEWAEAHAQELQQHAVAYVNSDTNSRGYLGMSGSHPLETFINDVARDITDPETNISVWKRAQLRQIHDAREQRERDELRRNGPLRIGALGSGSDYTVFIDHLGVASMNIGYGGEAGGGIYHSIYDDFYWYTHFDDPEFVYGRALAQTAGTAIMRLADAEVLPFNFGNLAATVRRYSEELQNLATSKRDEIVERNKQLDEGVFKATADPTKQYVPPQKEKVPPFLNFAPLQNGMEQLQRAADRYQSAFQQVQGANPAANAKIIQSERALLSDEGLPGRPWFRHQIYAPGFYTGYGVKTIPAVREAIEQGQWDLAEQQIAKVAKVLESEAAVINDAAAALEKK
jgi:N-acetylated-alpha-linked acidic dipeptidase